MCVYTWLYLIVCHCHSLPSTRQCPFCKGLSCHCKEPNHQHNPEQNPESLQNQTQMLVMISESSSRWSSSQSFSKNNTITLTQFFFTEQFHFTPTHFFRKDHPILKGKYPQNFQTKRSDFKTSDLALKYFTWFWNDFFLNVLDFGSECCVFKIWIWMILMRHQRWWFLSLNDFEKIPWNDSDLILKFLWTWSQREGPVSVTRCQHTIQPEYVSMQCHQFEWMIKWTHFSTSRFVQKSACIFFTNTKTVRTGVDDDSRAQVEVVHSRLGRTTTLLLSKCQDSVLLTGLSKISKAAIENHIIFQDLSSSRARETTARTLVNVGVGAAVVPDRNRVASKMHRWHRWCWWEHHGLSRRGHGIDHWVHLWMMEHHGLSWSHPIGLGVHWGRHGRLQGRRCRHDCRCHGRVHREQTRSRCHDRVGLEVWLLHFHLGLRWHHHSRHLSHHPWRRSLRLGFRPFQLWHFFPWVLQLLPWDQGRPLFIRVMILAAGSISQEVNDFKFNAIFNDNFHRGGHSAVGRRCRWNHVSFHVSWWHMIHDLWSNVMFFGHWI